MKRGLFLMITMLSFAALSLRAQFSYTEDFESYTVGNGIAAQKPDTWSTWNPGQTSSDALITDERAHGGTKSLKVVGTTSSGKDVVIKTGEITTGRYYIDFYMYIPAGKIAYYAILQRFDAANSIWGLQVQFKNGMAQVDGSGEGAAMFSYTPDTWLHLRHFVDLDNDLCAMYMNDELKHTYRWSDATFDDGTGRNVFAAIDIFGLAENNIPGEFYVDDISIGSIAGPQGPRNLTYEIQNENDVHLTWEAPAAKASVLSYPILRDGRTIGTIASTTTSYTDEHIYPGTYEYNVVANFGAEIGPSTTSQSVGQNLAVTVEGGTPRQTIVFEICTGTWCGNCPTAAKAIDALAASRDYDIAVVEYHSGDDFETPATRTREQFYAGKKDYFDRLYFNESDFGIPATFANGYFGFCGALPSVADQQQAYKSFYDFIKTIPSIYELNAELTLQGNRTYSVDIQVDRHSHYYGDDQMRLFAVLTETNIPKEWQGLHQVNFVARKVLPNANGTVLDFNDETAHATVQCSVDANYKLDKCELVLFVQNTADGRIQVAKKMKFDEAVTAVAGNELTATHVYPNPATDVLNIEAEHAVQRVELLTIAGQKVADIDVATNNAHIDVSGLAKGMYIMKIHFDNNIEMRKVNIY